MALQTQVGETQYRVDAADARRVLVQDAPGSRWRALCLCATAADAQRLVLALARGDMTAEEATDE